MVKLCYFKLNSLKFTTTSNNLYASIIRELEIVRFNNCTIIVSWHWQGLN